jgi:hypothetical protein
VPLLLTEEAPLLVFKSLLCSLLRTIPDNANRKEPLENIGKKNQKDPPETIADRNSNAIIPPADMKSMTKSNDGCSDGGVNAMLSFPFSADEVDDKEPKRKAFVAINYAPRIGGISAHMQCFSLSMFCICYAATQYCIHVHCVHILYEFINSLNSFNA